jgi:hypothetical protein
MRESEETVGLGGYGVLKGTSRGHDPVLNRTIWKRDRRNRRQVVVKNGISDAVADDKSTIKKAKRQSVGEKKRKGSLARYHCHEAL